jgi:cytosine/adenosine deaminase-related metal-dependent hydrolase
VRGGLYPQLPIGGRNTTSTVCARLRSYRPRRLARMNRPRMPSEREKTGPQRVSGPRDGGAVLRIRAAGLADAVTDLARPVEVLLRLPRTPDPGPTPREPLPGPARVIRIGDPEPPERVAADLTIDLPGAVLIPGLVNAHTHLDLTALGPRAHDPDGGFVPWVDMVRRERPADQADIADAVRLGTEKSRAGGVVAVGDILGAPGGRPATHGLEALRSGGLDGVGFVEVFGIGNRAGGAEERLDALALELAAFNGTPGGPLRAGLQPHAPNTVSLRVYRRASELARVHGLRLATHLAETPEELAFIADASGPQRDLLERLGIWSDDELADLGRGRHPVQHLASALEQAPFLVAHVNDADDAAIAMLARTGASVAYCPRASDYFGAPARLGPHRYREMLEAGVNVCLGTDSIINLDTPDRISPLDDARLLFRRDGVAASLLLDMLTRRGARALGLDERRFLFRRGAPIAGLVAVPVPGGVSGGAADAVLGGDRPPRLLVCGTKSG